MKGRPIENLPVLFWIDSKTFSMPYPVIDYIHEKIREREGIEKGDSRMIVGFDLGVGGVDGSRLYVRDYDIADMEELRREYEGFHGLDNGG